MKHIYITVILLFSGLSLFSQDFCDFSTISFQQSISDTTKYDSVKIIDNGIATVYKLNNVLTKAEMKETVLKLIKISLPVCMANKPSKKIKAKAFFERAMIFYRIGVTEACCNDLRRAKENKYRSKELDKLLNNNCSE